VDERVLTLRELNRAMALSRSARRELHEEAERLEAFIAD
jgi:hypothetical protein